MNTDHEARETERLLFLVLLIGLVAAGYAYKTYEDAVSGAILLPLIFAWMALLYLGYRTFLGMALNTLIRRRRVKKAVAKRRNGSKFSKGRRRK